MGAMSVLAAVWCVSAAELSARDIADRVLENNSFGFQNAVAKVTLKMVSKRGTERLRQIEISSMEDEDLKRTLVRFHSPADVAGTGFLIRQNRDRDDDQYLYLPALGKVKRITSNQRSQRFMGTDLTYADLESRNLRRSTLERLADTEVAGNPAYVIQAVPEDGRVSDYARTVTWVHTVSFVPLKVEFFDRKGRLLKVLRARRLEKKDGRWVVMDSVMDNQQARTRTHMKVNTIDFGADLSSAEFTQRALSEG